VASPAARWLAFTSGWKPSSHALASWPGGEEGEFQVFEALRVGKRGVGALRHGLGELGRIFLRRGGEDRHAAHELRVIGRGHTRHPVAESVPDDDRRSDAGVRDHRRNVAREVVQREPPHRPLAPADAARLRAQHPVSRASQVSRDLDVVFRAAAARGQDHDERPFAFGDRFDAGPARGGLRSPSGSHR